MKWIFRPKFQKYKKNMENMMIIPWSCHESWRPCQETWPPCRHHGMIMAMFRHGHSVLMARSWHGSHVFPTRVVLCAQDFQVTLESPLVLRRAQINRYRTDAWPARGSFTRSNLPLANLGSKNISESARPFVLLTCVQ